MDIDLGVLRLMEREREIPFDELVETAVVISSIETYIRMVHHDGWTLDAYRNWFRRMLHEVVVQPHRNPQNAAR